MPYGSSAYGGTAFGGNANSADEQIFFGPLGRPNYAPDVLHEASGNFSGSTEFYEILTQQGSEPGSGPAGIEYKVYTSPQEGITPQLQVTATGNTQLIIGADAIIIVTALIDGAVWATGLDFSVKGRPYTQ